MHPSQEPKYDVDSAGRIINRVTRERIPDDEPVFIFRARDCHAAVVLQHYLTMLLDPAHAEAVEGRLADFTAFAVGHPERMHEPGSAAPPAAKPALGKGLGALLPKKARAGAEITLVQVVVAPSHLVGLDSTGCAWIMPLHALGTDSETWDQLPLPGEQ